MHPLLNTAGHGAIQAEVAMPVLRDLLLQIQNRITDLEAHHEGQRAAAHRLLSPRPTGVGTASDKHNIPNQPGPATIESDLSLINRRLEALQHVMGETSDMFNSAI